MRYVDRNIDNIPTHNTNTYMHTSIELTFMDKGIIIELDKLEFDEVRKCLNCMNLILKTCGLRKK